MDEVKAYRLFLFSFEAHFSQSGFPGNGQIHQKRTETTTFWRNPKRTRTQACKQESGQTNKHTTTSTTIVHDGVLARTAAQQTR